MIIYRKILLFVFIFLSFSPYLVKAQGGSDYSIIGIGDILHDVSAVYDGIGGTSIALPSDHGINIINPALWSKSTMTRLSAGYRFRQHIVSSDKNLSVKQNNGKVDAILGIFSIDTTVGLAASVGIIPYSWINYYIAEPIRVEIDGMTVDGRNLFQGSGGISSAFIGASVNVWDDFSIGAAALVSFGLIKATTYTELYGDYYYSYNEKNENFRGYGFRGGLVYSGIENLTLGAFYASSQTMKGERKKSYYSASLNKDTIVENQDFTMKIPDSYGFGISYQLDRFLFAADYSIQDFKGFDYKQRVDTVVYKTSLNASFGISRLGNKNINAKFFDKITYSLGFSYNSLYYNINNTDINEYSGSFGMEIPVIGTAIIDAAVTIGKRGTLQNRLLEEYFGRLSIDISIGETWFKPFKREY